MDRSVLLHYSTEAQPVKEVDLIYWSYIACLYLRDTRNETMYRGQDDR